MRRQLRIVSMRPRGARSLLKAHGLAFPLGWTRQNSNRKLLAKTVVESVLRELGTKEETQVQF